MNTEQLRYFLSVSRHRNFTEAAREHYITQPAITHQISALERELGTKLFLRTTRSVTLTRAGELFLEDAKCMLDQEERARDRLQKMVNSQALELKIGYLSSATRHFLPKIIREFRELYPQVSVSFVRSDASGLQDEVEESSLDVLFSVLSDLDGMEGYSYRKLLSDYYCLVCPKQHPCLSNATIDQDKLATESFACLSKRAGAYMYKQFLQICREIGVSSSRITEYPAVEDILFSVECGQHVTILPYHIRSYMYSELAFIPLGGAYPSIELGMAWRHPSDNPAIGWFVELIHCHLVEHPELF